MASQLLPDLTTCLQQTPWRQLLGMMQRHGLVASTRWSKADLVEALHQHLLQPQTLTAIIPQLGTDVHHALTTLLAADGMLPAQTFLQTFGALRAYRPWHKDEPAPAQPWASAASPTEQLWWLGVLYLDPPRLQPGTHQRVVLPADLLPLLQTLLAPTPAQPRQLLPRPGLPPDLAWQMALWLATVAAAPINPVRGGWLPPTTLTHLAQRLGLDQAADFVPRRSERQQPYLLFLHSLALAAELITTSSPLALTPLAWQWLAATPADRWQQLWQAWLTAPVAATRAFPLPWATLTPDARRQLLPHLCKLSVSHFTPLAHLVEQSHLHDPYSRLAQPVTSTQDVVAALCTGPLFWFGILDVATTYTPSPPPSAPAPDAEDEVEPQKPAAIPNLLVRLTPQGAWLLDMAGWGPPSFAAPSPCATAPHTPELLLIAPQVQPSHLVSLAPYCIWSPPAFPALAQRLHLDPECIGAAVAAGLAPAQLLQTLTAALGQPPSRRLSQRLRTWAAAGQQVQLQPLLVLTTADAQLMGRLRSRKLVRSHLTTALSPTRSVVNGQTVAALVQTLRTLGLYVQLPPVAEPTTTATTGDRRDLIDPDDTGTDYATPPVTSPFATHTAFLWLLLRVYQGLGVHVELPVALPNDLLTMLRTQLSPAQQSAAESSAQQLLDQLARALHGYLRLPAWHLLEQRSDVLPTLEAALAQPQDLLISYWAGGRDEKSRRRITPYYLETQAGILYLTAYCHLRDAERVFRVDRIETATLLAKEGSER